MNEEEKPQRDSRNCERGIDVRMFNFIEHKINFFLGAFNTSHAGFVACLLAVKDSSEASNGFIDIARTVPKFPSAAQVAQTTVLSTCYRD